MHELSIAQSILDLVPRHVAPDALARVRSIELRLGALAGVDRESLAFSFAALVSGGDLAGVTLAITPMPARARCECCVAEREVALPAFACAACGSEAIELTGGFDLEVVAIELAEPSPVEMRAGLP